MSYDGMYSELSTRGTSSQILTQVLEARDQVVLVETNVENLEAQAASSAALSAGSASEAANSVASIGTSVADAQAAATAAAVSADVAEQAAADAITNSETALITSTFALQAAQEANDNSVVAISTANTALSTANGIASTANTALANSIVAVDDADAALVLATAAQPGDATLTALSGAPTAAYGIGVLNTASVAAAKTYLEIVDPSPTLIEGFDFYRLSAGTIKVSPGRAYIPNLGTVIRSPSELTLTLTGLTTSVMYHIYLYDDAGTAAVEYSSTAPALYLSPGSYNKTGDTSRRYLGSFLAISSTDCYKFTQCGNSVFYMENNGSGVLSLLSAGRTTVSTVIACSPAIPSTGVSIQASVANSIDTQLPVYLANADMGSVSSTNQLQSLDATTTGNIMSCTLPLSSSTGINYIFSGAGASGGLFIRAQGYLFRR